MLHEVWESISFLIIEERFVIDQPDVRGPRRRRLGLFGQVTCRLAIKKGASDESVVIHDTISFYTDLFLSFRYAPPCYVGDEVHNLTASRAELDGAERAGAREITQWVASNM